MSRDELKSAICKWVLKEWRYSTYNASDMDLTMKGLMELIDEYTSKITPGQTQINSANEGVKQFYDYDAWRKEPKPCTCPVCGGKGLVATGFYDWYNTTIGTMRSSATPETCRSCDGTGVVWRTFELLK